MKKLFLIIFAAAIVLQQSFAQTVVVGTVKDSITGSNVLSGTIEFVPIDTPKTNSLGEILFGYKTIAYINDGKFSAVLTEGIYNCIVGPFNITKPITIPAGDNVIDLATIYGNTDNSLVTFFQFTSLSNSLASMITGSVSGVATFNGRSGAVTLTSNDVYNIDIAAEKIKFNTNAYTVDTNVLAFAVLDVDANFSAATNARGLIIQNLGVDPATNAVNSITNNFATTNYVFNRLINVVSNNTSPTFSSVSINGSFINELDSYISISYLSVTNLRIENIDGSIPSSALIGSINLALLATNSPFDGAVLNSTSTSSARWYDGFADTNYVNTATNSLSTKTYAESLTNNFATTNFVKSYVDSLTVTNSGDSNISVSNITAFYVLSIKSNTTIAPFLNMSASEVRSASLLITNGTGSNCTIKLPDGTSCLGGTTLTVTNAQRRIISVGGIINFTNAVSQALP